MKNFVIISVCLATVVILQGLSSQPSRYEGKIIKDIKFVGLQNVDADDLADDMSIGLNVPLKASEVRQDIRTIFSKGNFEKVDVEIEDYRGGVQLRFIFKERPIVKEVEFKGYSELNEQDLKSTVLVKEGDVFRKDRLERSVKLLKVKYNSEGLFNSVIRYRVDPHKGSKSNVNVTFIIDEGEEILVQKFTILGARKIHQRELKSYVDTTEDGLFQDGTFQADVFEQDKVKILMYYKMHGYLDAEIAEESVEYEWLNPNEKTARGIFITLKMAEGERYYFDGCTVKINKAKGEKKVFTEREIYNDLELTSKGDVFDFQLFMKDRQMISFNYASKGYIFARVIPKRTITEREIEIDGNKVKRKFLKIDYIIEEGSKAYIDMIIIKGNKKTLDKVIRRELLVKENQLFDSYKMQKSRERVYNLGFFKEVNIDVRPGSREGYMNLVVDVKEQPTGTISLGGGYGTTSGFSIFADLSENNLFGTGRRVGVKVEYGPLRNSLTLSYTDRWFLDRPLSFTGSVFYRLYTRQTSSLFINSLENAEYKKQSLGYSLSFGYRILNYFQIGSLWSHAFTSIVDPTGNSNDEVFKAVALGTQEKRTIGFFAVYDTRNNYMNPTSGLRAEFMMAFTGGHILGGDDHYIKYTPELSVYLSPFHLPYLRSHPVVFEFRINGTFITTPWGRNSLVDTQNYLTNPWVEAEDRLFMGGPETIRGWDYLDRDFPNSWHYVGLFHRILYGFELRIPIHPQMLWFAFFFDAGALYSDRFWERQFETDLLAYANADRDNEELYYIDEFWKQRSNILSYFKYSWGFGFRIQIPMMPLRFWFGQKLVYDGGFRAISGFNFQFAIGDMRF